MFRREFAIFFLIFCFVIASIPAASCKSSPPIIYVAGDGSGDYNCAGKSAQVQINQALQFVAKNSGYTTVRLKGPFAYVIDDTILIGSNTILEGDSTVVIKLANHAGWPTMKPLIQQISNTGNSNITIRGFEVDANYEGNSEIILGRGYYNVMYFIRCNNVKVYNMYMHDGNGDGLRINQGKNIQFYNNTIYKLGHDGLFAIKCENVEAWKNRITCRTNSALRIMDSNKVKFHDNVIDSFHQWNAGGPGIQIEKSPDTSKQMGAIDDVEVYNNIIRNTFGPGIWMVDYDTSPGKGDQGKSCHIYNNIFYSTGTNPGITWTGGIVASGFNGTIIENNVFDGCYNAAVSLMSPPGYTPKGGFKIIVRNNIISNTLDRIKESSGTGYAVVNNFPGKYYLMLQNNCIYNNTGGDYNNCTSTTDIYVNSLIADQKTHDYHLQSEEGRWNGKTWVRDKVSSPCIDAGNRYSDYSNEPEPNGDRINIGPDGNTKYASKSYLNKTELKPPVADFGSNTTSGPSPLKVAFTDMTGGKITGWKWSFGDNTYSTVKNPVHTYNKTGKYTVSLTVWNNAGSNTKTKSNYVVVGTSAVKGTLPAITEIQINTNISMKLYPEIFGNRIVWQDYRNKNLGNGNWDIYMYDLSTSRETQVTTNKFYQENPEIYGDKIVWEDGRSGNSEIYMYDISTRKESRITSGGSDHTHPAIYNDRIVWEEKRIDGKHDIYMYNISTRKESRITSGGSDYIHPAIYGDRIVWEEKRNGEKNDICMYTISTRKVIQITKNGKAYNPAIYGNRIIWEDRRLADVYDPSSSNIYRYDISTRNETRVSSSSRAYNAAIYGNRIVWQDYRNANDDIYMYDITTSREILITTNKYEQEFPSIYGDRIVWQDYRKVTYDPDIYMGIITYPPVAAFSASIVSGKAPLSVKFTDKSTGSPTSWTWNFGDKSTSTSRNPTHKYSKAGKYTVSLTVRNAAGSNSATKSRFITVK